MPVKRVLAAALAFAVSGTASAAFVDNFDIAGYTSTSCGFSSTLLCGTGTQAASAATVLGGSREIVYDFGPFITPSNSVQVTTSNIGTPPNGPGSFEFAGAGLGTSGGPNTFSLVYDGNADGVTSGPGGLNANLTLTTSLNVVMRADAWSVVPNVSTLSLTLQDGSGSIFTQAINPSGAVSPIWNTYSFTLASFGGLDLADIDRITLSYVPYSNAQDGRIDAISLTEVPVPAALPLLIAGLGVFAAVGRRRRGRL